ncbi:MAG: DUF6069 family protein [Pseudonocardia sp.]|nr:DUF6069 family protein [Pseudonocardia sp.]
MSSKQTSKAMARAQAVAATVVGAVAVWVVAEPVLGFALRGPAQGGGATHDVNAVVVAVAALAASLAGWALLAVLERFTSRARGLWTAAALTVAVLSLAGPLFSAGITAANQAWLGLLHVSVAAVLIPLLRRTTPQPARRAEGAASASDPAVGAVVSGGEPR